MIPIVIKKASMRRAVSSVKYVKIYICIEPKRPNHKNILVMDEIESMNTDTHTHTHRNSAQLSFRVTERHILTISTTCVDYK